MSCLLYTQTSAKKDPGKEGSAHFFRMDMIGCFLFLAGGTRIDGVVGSKSGRLGGQSLEGWANWRDLEAGLGNRKLGELGESRQEPGGLGGWARCGDRWTGGFRNLGSCWGDMWFMQSSLVVAKLDSRGSSSQGPAP